MDDKKQEKMESSSDNGNELDIVQSDERTMIRISVRNLVEFVCRSGDLDDRHGGMDSMTAMQEGSRMHRKIQRRMGSEYHGEFPLKYIVSYPDYDLGIEGRADGIIFTDDSPQDVTIDEIKGMYLDVKAMEEPVMIHLAQAKVYAYIYATQQKLSSIWVQMTYCNLDTEELRYFREQYEYPELESWFLELLQGYQRWSDYQYYHKVERQRSIKELEFPFPYRNGQKKLVTDVYRSISRKKILFIQAPTGTGKTVSTIYPAVKAVGEELADRIFYLTAKTVTQTVARETFTMLGEEGYQGKTACITAKDKMCLCQERNCNPQGCPYAKGHFDRINDAVFDLLQTYQLFDRETFMDWARQRMVCPFELSLDTASWVDHIICDYNYVFDPNVYLKRFFGEGIRGDYIFLIDEAHNLVDRAREMYSATLVKEDFLMAKKVLKRFDKRFERQLEKCNRLMLEWKRACERYMLLPEIDEFIFSLMRLAALFDDFWEKDYVFDEKEEILQFYFDVRNFLNISEGYDEHYRLYCDYKENREFQLHMLCVDPSLMLQSRLDRGNATVFFSATLLPIMYYKKLLSTRQDNYAIYADTEFDAQHRKLLIGRNVTSKYTRRGVEEYQKFAEYIYQIVHGKVGNYMVFCPSYRLIDEICKQYMALNLGEADIICQTNHMSEKEREEFLAEFEITRDHSLVAFCVLGGIFSEGIDLTRERLIGSIIVGTGLPQVGNQREILSNYFQETSGNGFQYAYLYPGMNKVLQAAGRVIRTKEDRGVIALLDERFLNTEYSNIFPRDWTGYDACNIQEVPGLLEDFWATCESK